MINKLMFTFCAVLVTYLQFDLITFSAQVGRSFSGGGSRSSSYTGSGFKGFSSGGSPSFFFFGGGSQSEAGFGNIFLTIVVFAMIIIIIRNFMKNISVNQNDNLGSSLVLNPAEEQAVISTVKNFDSKFERPKFEQQLTQNFLELQTAWTSLNLEKAQAILSVELFEVLSKQLKEFKSNRTQPFITCHEICTIEYADFVIERDYHYLTVLFGAKMTAYVENRGHQVVEGDKHQIDDLKFTIVLKRSNKQLEHEVKGDSISSCPNCGGTLNLSNLGKCELCQTLVVGGNYDWVIDEYGAFDFITLDNIRNKKQIYQAVLKNDSQFSGHQLETYMKNVILSVQEAQENKKLELIKPYVSDQLYDTYEQKMTERHDQQIDYVADGQEFRQIMPLNYFTTQTHEFLEYYLEISLIEYEKKSTTENDVFVNGTTNTRKYQVYNFTIERDLFVKTNGLAKNLDVINSKLVTNCPNCCGTTEITSSGRCEFCQSIITVNDYGWILTKLTRIS
ncbi:MAG: TIM44-like domain-containing protein [Mycoplasmatales bacterium]